MHASTRLVLALAVLQGVLAKSVIFSFPETTDDSVVTRAKDELVAGGGTILFEYDIIKGFAADAPDAVVGEVSAWATEKYGATVEDDETVTISKH